MSEKIRFGVIGTGGVGVGHLKSLRESTHALPAALAESNPLRAKGAAERYGVTRVYADYRELLEQPDIEAVTIALPNYLHAIVATESLAAGKHVLLEKPMATSYQDALKIADMVRKTGRTFMVAQNHRFNKFTQMAKERIGRGDLGVIYHTRGFWLRRWGIPRNGSWFTQKKLAGGGCTYDLGVHVLDLCFHLLGDFEPASVLGHLHSRFGPRGLGEMDWGKSEITPGKPFDVEDYSLALLKMKTGATLLIEISWAANQEKSDRELGIDLYGTEGGMSLFPARWRRPTPDGYQTVELQSTRIPYSQDRVQYFAWCLAERKQPLVQLEESLKVQQVLDAIYQSAATGRPIAFD